MFNIVAINKCLMKTPVYYDFLRGHVVRLFFIIHKYLIYYFFYEMSAVKYAKDATETAQNIVNKIRYKNNF